MKEHNKIILRPENPDDPQGVLKNIVDTVNELIPDAGESAGKILRGIGEQKLAKVSEIKARAYKEIAEIQLANQKLVIEREENLKRLHLQEHADDKEHQARMYALKTERLKALADIVAAIKELRELGCEIDMDAVIGILEPKAKRRTTKTKSNIISKSRRAEKTSTPQQ